MCPDLFLEENSLWFDSCKLPLNKSLLYFGWSLTEGSTVVLLYEQRVLKQKGSSILLWIPTSVFWSKG